jgi:hypothetical protein
MRYVATVIKTMEMQSIVYAESRQNAREMVDDLGDGDFSFQSVIDYEVNIKEMEE